MGGKRIGLKGSLLSKGGNSSSSFPPLTTHLWRRRMKNRGKNEE
jgi:hypothetical protein